MSISSVKTGAIGDSLLAGNPSFIPTSFESIATATGTGSSSTITFSSIPSTYASLQLRINGVANADTDQTAEITFNSDSGNNYTLHRLTGNGSSASAFGFTASSGNKPYGWAYGGGTIPGVSIIDIHDYASTTRNKTIRILSGWDNNSSGRIELQSSVWLNTNAISSITITNGNARNWTTSAVFSLYGIKG